MAKVQRIGILTGGGDCPGLNAVIRAAVRTAIRDHDLEVLGIQLGFEGLLEKSCIPLTNELIRGILPKGGTLLRTTNRGNPFEYGDGKEDRSAQVVKNIRELGIDGIIAIGGDGTLKIAQRLCDVGIPMVAVPKTIDNDLAATDFTFGFMTAVEIATDAVDRLHTTAESHNRVMILELMGRNAGWITLYAGLAGGADIILIPEIPYKPEAIIESIRERQGGGSHFDIIVVAEGAKRAGGEERYTGTYGNDLYGPLEVVSRPGGGLQITLGPQRQTYPVHPFDGDEMWWQFAGENAGPPAAATFRVEAGGRAAAVTLDHFDDEGLGTFVRR